MESLQQNTSQKAKEAIDKGIFPGVAIDVSSPLYPEHNFQIYEGHHEYEQPAHSVHQTSVYDLASLTKTVTYLLANKLAEKGIINYSDKVAGLLGLKGKGTELIEVRHLLTFTIDFEIATKFWTLYSPELNRSNADLVMDIVRSADLRFQPGAAHIYRDITTVLLSLYLEEQTGDTLQNLFREHLFRPLDVSGVYFTPNKYVPAPFIVPTEKRNLIRSLEVGDIHDETAQMFAPRRVGCAGLFGNLVEVSKLFRAVLLSYSKENKDPFFNEKTRELMLKDQLGIPGHGFTYGFDRLDISPNYTKCKCANQNMILFTAFTGCSIMIEPIRWQTMILILSNRVWPQRPENNSGIIAFRKEVANLVFNNCKHCTD